MPFRPTALVAVSLATLALLSGCSFSASVGDAGTDETTTDESVTDEGPATIAGADLAQKISDFFEEQNGVASDIDCGADDIAIEDDAQISCLGIDPTTGDEVPLYVTLSNVDGESFDFDVSQ